MSFMVTGLCVCVCAWAWSFVCVHANLRIPEQRWGWCVQVDNHAVVLSGVKNKSSLSSLQPVALFKASVCVGIPSCLCSTVLTSISLKTNTTHSYEDWNPVVTVTVPELCSSSVSASSVFFRGGLYIVEAFTRCVFRLVRCQRFYLLDFIKMSLVTDRKTSGPPPPPKIKKSTTTVPSSTDQQVHCCHLGLFFLFKTKKCNNHCLVTVISAMFLKLYKYFLTCYNKRL